MKTKLFLIAAALFVYVQCYAQSGRQVRGTVLNTEQHPLKAVVITLTSKQGDSAITQTDANGKFKFGLVKGAEISISASLVGYQSIKKNYTLAAGDSGVGVIVLMTKGEMLNAARHPIVHADTVNYHAGQYKLPNKADAGDIIKKMPGVVIDANGNIVTQGQQVTKVRIDGKDFTGGDWQTATKNLPADAVSKIQIIDNYGDQANLTGIKSGDPTKIINITISGANPLTKPGNESYKTITENTFNSVKSSPLSTFSVDVDAASYSNVRRYINEGQMPPPDAVRIEEMINYFNYNLAGPTNNSPVAIHTELSSAPWNAKHRLLRIGLKAKTIDTDKLPASNLVFLIDVSGSMNEPNKLPLVKAAMKMLTDQLRPQDKVAIVVYAGQAGLALPSTAGDQKTVIKDAIDNLSAGGSTAGGEGIKLAYRIAKENFMKKGNNRIILATDGDFNVGPNSDEDMEHLIIDERESKVAISIMGFGMGNLKDSKMETMADKGNGNYAYIDNITEARKAFVTEFGGTLFTVAKDVKIQIEFNPTKVQAYRLLGYEDRMLEKEDFNNDRKDAGDMGSGHTVTALYELVPAGIKDDDYAGNVDPLKYQNPEPAAQGNALDEMLTVKFRYKENDSSASKMSSVTVKDKPENFNSASADFRFASSVAEFGMLLRNSQFKHNASFDQAISIAKAAKGEDPDGYRAEFIRLAESAKLLAGSEVAPE